MRMGREGSVLAEPDRRSIEEPTAHVVARVEHVTEMFLPEVDAIETDLDPRHDGQTAFGGVGDRRE